MKQTENKNIQTIFKQLHNMYIEEISHKKIYIVYNVQKNTMDPKDFFTYEELNQVNELANKSIFDCILVEDEKEFCEIAKYLNSEKTIVLNLTRRGSINNKKMLVNAYCDLHDLAVISSSGYTVNLCRNKYHFEQYLLNKTNFGIETIVINYSKIEEIKSKFENRKVIVKQIQSAGSVLLDNNSVFVYKKENDLIKTYGNYKAVIQEYIEGDEIEVPFIVYKEKPIILGCYKILKKDEIITEKASNEFSYEFEEIFLGEKMSEIVKAINIVVDDFYVETYGRVDFKINETQCRIFDIATTPFFIEHTSFAKSLMKKTQYNIIDILCLLKIDEINDNYSPQ